MLTTLYSHWYTATCFSPQRTILKDNWSLLSARSTKHVSRCKYLAVKTSLTSVHGCEENQIHSLLQDPFHRSLLYSYSTPIAYVIYRSDAIWLRCAVYARCPTISSTSFRHSHIMHWFLIRSKLKCFCSFNGYFKLHQGVTHRPMRCCASQKTHYELQKLWLTHKKGVPYSGVASPPVPQYPTSFQFSSLCRTN